MSSEPSARNASSLPNASAGPSSPLGSCVGAGSGAENQSVNGVPSRMNHRAASEVPALPARTSTLLLKLTPTRKTRLAVPISTSSPTGAPSLSYRWYVDRIGSPRDVWYVRTIAVPPEGSTAAEAPLSRGLDTDRVIVSLRTRSPSCEYVARLRLELTSFVV